MKHVKETVGTALIILAVFFAGIKLIDQWMGREGQRALYQELTAAATHCYATEGRYPPDLSYIQRQYGIRTDRRRYTVQYHCTAPDSAPQIYVTQNHGGAMA